MALTSDATLQRRDETRAGTTVFSGSGGGGTTGIQVVILDASGGNVTEVLPDPSTTDTAIGHRVDSTTNTATLEDPNGTDIEILDGDDVSSIDFEPEEAKLFVTDDEGTFWTEVRQPLSASAEEVTSDDGTNDSPSLTLQANYDGSGTAGDGTVTATARDLDLFHRVTDPNAPVSEAVLEIDASQVLRVQDDGRVIPEGDLSFPQSANQSIEWASRIKLQDSGWAEGDYFDIAAIGDAGSEALSVDFGTDSYFHLEGGHVGVNNGAPSYRIDSIGDINIDANSNYRKDGDLLSYIDKITLSLDEDPNTTGDTLISVDIDSVVWTLAGGQVTHNGTDTLTTNKIDDKTIRIDADIDTSAHDLTDHNDVATGSATDDNLIVYNTDVSPAQWERLPPSTGLFRYNAGWEFVGVGNGVEVSSGSLRTDGGAIAGTHLVEDGTDVYKVNVDTSGMPFMESFNVDANNVGNSIIGDGDTLSILGDNTDIQTSQDGAGNVTIEFIGSFQDTDIKVVSASFTTGDGILTLSRENVDGDPVTAVSVDLDGRYFDATTAPLSDSTGTVSLNYTDPLTSNASDQLDIKTDSTLGLTSGQLGVTTIESITFGASGNNDPFTFGSGDPTVTFVGSGNITVTSDSVNSQITIDQTSVAAHGLEDHSQTALGSPGSGAFVYWTGSQWADLPMGTGVLEYDAGWNFVSTYVQSNVAESISSQWSFAPSTATPPFTLNANASGELVDGLNADQLDGQEASAFMESFNVDANNAGNSAISDSDTLSILGDEVDIQTSQDGAGNVTIEFIGSTSAGIENLHDDSSNTVGQSTVGIVTDSTVSFTTQTAPGDINFTSSSDRRLKENIQDVTADEIYSRFMSLDVKSFYWKEDGRAENAFGVPKQGLIGQDVRSLFPEHVGKGPDDMWGIDYATFAGSVGVLMTQHAHKRINELEQQVEELKSQI